MIHFENANRTFADLPKHLLTLIPSKKPHVLSSLRKRYIYKLLELWSYATEGLHTKYEQELYLLMILNWKDYKVYGQHTIEKLMKK